MPAIAGAVLGGEERRSSRRAGEPTGALDADIGWRIGLEAASGSGVQRWRHRPAGHAVAGHEIGQRSPCRLRAATLIASEAEAWPGMTTTQEAAEGAAKEQTCGQEMAAAAEVPQRWQDLIDHVAANMEWHATWVGTASPGAKREHDALLRVAGEYRAMAAAGGRAAAAMKVMKDLGPTPHDPSGLDRVGQARWMRAKIQMQRQFAALLTRHADESEQALTEMESRPDR